MHDVFRGSMLRSEILKWSRKRSVCLKRVRCCCCCLTKTVMGQTWKPASMECLNWNFKNWLIPITACVLVYITWKSLAFMYKNARNYAKNSINYGSRTGIISKFWNSSPRFASRYTSYCNSRRWRWNTPLTTKGQNALIRNTCSLLRK